MNQEVMFKLKEINYDLKNLLMVTHVTPEQSREASEFREKMQDKLKDDKIKDLVKLVRESSKRLGSLIVDKPFNNLSKIKDEIRDIDFRPLFRVLTILSGGFILFKNLGPLGDQIQKIKDLGNYTSSPTFEKLQDFIKVVMALEAATIIYLAFSIQYLMDKPDSPIYKYCNFLSSVLNDLVTDLKNRNFKKFVYDIAVLIVTGFVEGIGTLVEMLSYDKVLGALMTSTALAFLLIFTGVANILIIGA